MCSGYGCGSRCCPSHWSPRGALRFWLPQLLWERGRRQPLPRSKQETTPGGRWGQSLGSKSSSLLWATPAASASIHGEPWLLRCCLSLTLLGGLFGLSMDPLPHQPFPALSETSFLQEDFLALWRCLRHQCVLLGQEPEESLPLERDTEPTRASWLGRLPCERALKPAALGRTHTESMKSTKTQATKTPVCLKLSGLYKTGDPTAQRPQSKLPGWGSFQLTQGHDGKWNCP